MDKNVPKPSSEAARKRMKAAKPSNTLPELKVQSSLERMGIQFEVDAKPIANLRRKADILLRTQKIAVFIDGCFWHGCPVHGTQAKSNAEFWAEKISRNKERDADTDRRLKEEGWVVIRVWEHEDADQIAQLVSRLLKFGNK